ncbi:MAG: hypothetical protein ACKPCM_09340 [Pseudanabaena sp.]
MLCAAIFTVAFTLNAYAFRGIFRIANVAFASKNFIAKFIDAKRAISQVASIRAACLYRYINSHKPSLV